MRKCPHCGKEIIIRYGSRTSYMHQIRNLSGIFTMHELLKMKQFMKMKPDSLRAMVSVMTSREELIRISKATYQVNPAIKEVIKNASN